MIYHVYFWVWYVHANCLPMCGWMIQLSGHRSATQICIVSLSYQDTRRLYWKNGKLQKALQAHKHFLSGWVQNVVHVILSSGNVLLMCDVRPSYCTSDKPHKPWIALSESVYVTAGHRTCMAGYVFLKKYIIYLSISFYKTHDHLLDWNHSYHFKRKVGHGSYKMVLIGIDTI